METETETGTVATRGRAQEGASEGKFHENKD